jgi:uncharacterized membrane protein YgcG
MNLLLSIVGLFVFGYLTDFSSESAFNSLACPLGAGICAVVLLTKVIVSLNNSNSSGNGSSSGDGGGFSGGSSGGDCGGDGGGC